MLGHTVECVSQLWADTVWLWNSIAHMLCSVEFLTQTHISIDVKCDQGFEIILSDIHIHAENIVNPIKN